MWGSSQPPGPHSSATDRAKHPQYTYSHDQHMLGQPGMTPEATSAAQSGFFHDAEFAEARRAGTHSHQLAVPTSTYGSHPAFVMHRAQAQQSPVNMPYAQHQHTFPEPDPSLFLRSMHQPPQPLHPRQLQFEQEHVAASGMHSHLQPPQHPGLPPSGHMPDQARIFQRYPSSVGDLYSDSRDQVLDRSLMSTATWPVPSTHHSDFHAASGPYPNSLPDSLARSSRGVPSSQMFPAPGRRGSPLRHSPAPRPPAPAPQPSGLYSAPFAASRAPTSPSPPLQMQMQAHAAGQDSADYPCASAAPDDFQLACMVADACAPLPPSGAPGDSFLQTIHESDGSTTAPPERKLHNQPSQCSTTTSFGGGSRRFLARNVSSFSNSSVADSFRSRNSSIRSYDSSFRSIGGASSYGDFRFDSFRELPEPSDDNSDPSPSPMQALVPGGTADVPSSPPGRRLSAATLAAAAAVAASDAATAAAVADPSVNAATAAAAIMAASGEPLPSYLSSECPSVPPEYDQQLAYDMGSLTRKLDQAPSMLPAVAQVLSDTAPPFKLGLPTLTKLLCNSSKRGRHSKALAIFHAAPALGLAPDLPLCNAALMAAGSAGSPEASSAIFGGMVAVGIEPDAVTYRAASTALAKHGHIQRALQVLLRMLCSERVHDSTALMTGVLAAGRHGAWAVGELMLVSAFKSRLKLTRLAALPPPAVSAVPEQFQEVLLALCKHNGITPSVEPGAEPSQQGGPPEAGGVAARDPQLQHSGPLAPPHDVAGTPHSPTSAGSAGAGAGAGAVDAPQPLEGREHERPSSERKSPLCESVSYGSQAAAPPAAANPAAATSAAGAASSEHLPPSVALAACKDLDGDAAPEPTLPDGANASAVAPAPEAPVSGGFTAGPDPDANSSHKSTQARTLGLAGPGRLLSMRHSAPVESDAPESSPIQAQVGGAPGCQPLGAAAGARSMRRVASADRLKPGLKQKRGPDVGPSGPLHRGSMDAAAAAALLSLAREEAEAAGGVGAVAEPPRKRHLSPGYSFSSGGSWGGSVRSHRSPASGGSDAGHLGGVSPFLDSHPAESALMKRNSSFGDASVAKLALALADVRLSLTSEASLGAAPAAGEQHTPACSFLTASSPQPLDAGAFSTGGQLQTEGLEDASIAAGAAASAAAVVSAGQAAPVIAPAVGVVSAEHTPPGAPTLLPSGSAPSQSPPRCVAGIAPGASGAAAPLSGATQSGASRASVLTAAWGGGGARDTAAAAAVRDEATSMAVADPSDPLLHACFNAQLLAYSTDPALLDRSTEILMTMLESGGEVCPDVISFNIILRTVCATEHLQVAPALLEMMGIARVQPLVSTYAIYMAGAASAGDPWLVEHGWQSMLSAHIVPDITCISLYLSALFQLGQYMDAATLFLRIASPPVFLAPDACTIAMILAIWMHHQLTAATGEHAGGQRTASTHQDTLAMTSSLCRAIGAHTDVALEATQVLVEELTRAGCMVPMHAALTAQQQLASSAGRMPVAQGIAQLLTTMRSGGVAECSGICVGGIVRRASEMMLRLGGAPLPAPHDSSAGAA